MPVAYGRGAAFEWCCRGDKLIMPAELRQDRCFYARAGGLLFCCNDDSCVRRPGLGIYWLRGSLIYALRADLEKYEIEHQPASGLDSRRAQ